jgi:hypothetical protein
MCRCGEFWEIVRGESNFYLSLKGRETTTEVGPAFRRALKY